MRTAAAIAITLLAAGTATAQPSITWFTIDAGGQRAAGTLPGGAAMTMDCTIGQVDAAPPVTGGPYTLAGGFWPGAGGSTLSCAADFNNDGNLDPDDLSDYITCFFTQAQFPGSCPHADFNTDGNSDPDDLSDYITAFFGGCG